MKDFDEVIKKAFDIRRRIPLSELSAQDSERLAEITNHPAYDRSMDLKERYDAIMRYRALFYGHPTNYNSPEAIEIDKKIAEIRQQMDEDRQASDEINTKYDITVVRNAFWGSLEKLITPFLYLFGKEPELYVKVDERSYEFIISFFKWVGSTGLSHISLNLNGNKYSDAITLTYAGNKLNIFKAVPNSDQDDERSVATGSQSENRTPTP